MWTNGLGCVALWRVTGDSWWYSARVAAETVTHTYPLDRAAAPVSGAQAVMSMLPALGRWVRKCAVLSRLPRPQFPAPCLMHCSSRYDAAPSTAPLHPNGAAGAATPPPRASSASQSSAPSTSSTAAGYDHGLSIQSDVSWAASVPVTATRSAASSPSYWPSSDVPPAASQLSRPSSSTAPRPARRAPKGAVEFFVDIDSSGQLAYPERPYVDPHVNTAKGRLTPLALELHEQVKVRGPLTMSDFMYQCMQNPQHGYYTTKQNVIGGRAEVESSGGSGRGLPVGDFITSPEISQLFGELLGVWMVDCWHKLGKPPSFSLVELGPGRGTLMRDMLRTIRHWPAMHSAVEVHLLESSPLMREQQREMLGVTVQQDGHTPFYSPAAPSPSVSDAAAIPTNVILPPDYIPSTAASTVSTSSSTSAAASSSSPLLGDVRVSGFSRDRVRVTWHSSLASLPTSRPILFVGHEFLDALPVYHFVYRKERGWSEVLVDADYSTDSPYHFRFVLSPAATPASSIFMGERAGEENEMVEVQAASATVVEDITQRIGRQTGAALFIDYASSQPPQPTLQAVQNHQHVHPLHEPGETDLTTQVDFQEMAASADKAAHVSEPLDVFTLPVISQNSFLRNMNIARRLEMLVNDVWDRVDTQTTDSQQLPNQQALTEDEAERLAESMIQAATRLVSEDSQSGGMGGLFQVMAVVHAKLGTDIAAWNEAEVREKRQRDKQKRAESRSQTLAKNLPPAMRRRRAE